MTTTFLRGIPVACALVLCAPLVAAQGAKAPAKDKPAAAPVAKGKVDVKEAGDALKSNEAARIETALVNIRVAGKDGGGKQLTAAIVAKLKEGLPRELLKKALDTLGDLEDPNAAEAGVIYMAHRDPEVRLAAVHCLGGAKGPIATKALRDALGDLDARVHSMAATYLGTTKSADAVPDLVLALDKGVTAAASSIGMLCDDKTCDALLERMKSKPFDVISSGLEQVLARKEIKDDYKKKVITQVRELASQKAREFLQSVRQAWPPNGSKAIADALDKAIKDLEGASK
jgi:HEAT repeat protein